MRFTYEQMQGSHSGAQLLLYPHQGSWIERIEDSMAAWRKLSKNLKE
ncbi:MAG: hypothetical protein O2960_03960 [Verrucomicrobia bacterium]|nr:hypothetical protein [Verrucomicrobiota bacterium]